MFKRLRITFLVWRCGEFLAQKLNRITTVETCTNVSYKHFSRHMAKPMLAFGFLSCFSTKISTKVLSVLVHHFLLLKSKILL